MEFSFEYFWLFEQFNLEPGYVVVWAAFGVPLCMLVPALVTWLMPDFRIKKKASEAAYTILAIIWVVGFIATILLLFADVPGLKIFFIWCLLVIAVIIFYIFHGKEIKKIYGELKVRNGKT